MAPPKKGPQLFRSPLRAGKLLRGPWVRDRHQWERGGKCRVSSSVPILSRAVDNLSSEGCVDWSIPVHRQKEWKRWRYWVYGSSYVLNRRVALLCHACRFLSQDAMPVKFQRTTAYLNKIFVSCSSRKPGFDFPCLPTATRFQRSNVNAGQQESTQVIQKQ